MSDNSNSAKNDRRITVTIEGERYDALERIANAMNSVSWCGGDNTPESVFYNFVWHWDEQALDNTGELTDCIINGIATSDDGTDDAPEPLHHERIAELHAAFKKAGLAYQYP